MTIYKNSDYFLSLQLKHNQIYHVINDAKPWHLTRNDCKTGSENTLQKYVDLTTLSQKRPEHGISPSITHVLFYIRNKYIIELFKTQGTRLVIRGRDTSLNQ